MRFGALAAVVPCLARTVLLGVPSVWAAVPHDVPTLKPRTYVRDYSNDHLDNPEFLEWMRSNPPELLVVGKDLVLHHSLGPVVGIGGENVSHSRGKDALRISAEQMREKQARLTTMVRDLHEAGVELVMPYICTKTIFGDHETRIGLWDFYDHWDEYAEWDLGPKPRDPMEWMRRNSDGSLQLTYPFTLDKYEPNHRYAACCNQPGWRQHMRNVVRLIAACGYDGTYLDNNANNRCRCEVCQAKFAARMHKKHAPEQLKELFGFERPEDVRLAEEPPGLLWYESCRFWVDCNVEFLTMLKEHAEKTRKPFHIFANPGTWWRGAQEIQDDAIIASFIQSEENGFEYGAHAGMVEVPLIGDLTYRAYNYRALQYKYTQATRSGLRTTMTTRPYLFRQRRSADFIRMNAETLRVNLAEAAAFGGGGAKNVQMRWDMEGQITRYRRFLADHADLYEGYECYAPVAVLCFAQQYFYSGEHSHLFRVDDATRQLFEAQIPFDLVLETTFDAQRLRRYEVVMLPAGIAYVSDEVVAALAAYVREGGGLVLCDEATGKYDTMCRERRPALDLLKATANQVSAVGHGRCLYSPAPMPEHGFAAAAESVAGRELSVLAGEHEWDPRSLKLNAYIRGEGSDEPRMVLHLVNYNVKLSRDNPEPPIPIEHLRIRLPVPENMSIGSVTSYDPAQAHAADLAYRQDDRELTFELPRLEVYAAIDIH